MKFSTRYFAALVVGLISSQVAYAVNCTENIIHVISHSSGNVYFTSDRTCHTWCQAGNNATATSQNYALLLMAQRAKRPIILSFPNNPSCDTQNPTFAVPDYIVIEPIAR